MAPNSSHCLEVAVYSVSQPKRFDTLQRQAHRHLATFPGFVSSLCLRGLEDARSRCDLVIWSSVEAATVASDLVRREARFDAFTSAIAALRHFGHFTAVVEELITSFEDYGAELDRLPLSPLVLVDQVGPERALLVEEAKVGCMLGMLLCLDRDQRAAYVIGDVVGANSAVAAEILGITPAAFRKRLERARRDLTTFMNDKCGLVNPANPCRCEKKTRAFIKEGWVDPARLKFTNARVAQLNEEAPTLSNELGSLEVRAATLFRDHPLVDGPDLAARLANLLEDNASPDLYGGRD